MATDSPVYNRLQSVFYRLPFMYDLWATATATDRNSGQPDRKSGCLRSIFRSGPVQFPVYMTGLSNTRHIHLPLQKSWGSLLQILQCAISFSGLASQFGL